LNIRVSALSFALSASLIVAAPQHAWAQPSPASDDARQVQQNPPAAVGEQGTKPTRGFLSALVHNLGDDVKHMPRRNSVYWLAGGGALALAVHPLDDDINAHLVNRNNDGLWKPGHIIGSTPVVLTGSLAAYLTGRWTGKSRLQHLGMDELEGSLLAEAFTQGIKVAVRRDRPTQVDGAQSHTYSFPSGHAMMTFAAATVLQQHLGYRAAIPTYLVSSYVAMSRLHDNRHFASDVVFGAAMGIVIGRSVTFHGRNFYGSPALVPGGAAIQFALAN
jgi:membrane-associated phospholipid phosphatase